MSLPKCEQCRKSFKWKQTFSSLAFAYKPIVCCRCVTEHQITLPSRVLMACLTTIPIVILTYTLNRYFSSIYLTLGMLLLVALVILLSLPFFVTYRST